MRRGLRLRILALLASVLPVGLSCRDPAPEPANPPGVEKPLDDGDKIEPQPPPGAGPFIDNPPPDVIDPPQENAEPLTLDQINQDELSVEELVKIVSRLGRLDDQRIVLETVIRRQPDHREALLWLMEVTQMMGVELALQEDGREESIPYLNRSAEAARIILQQNEPLTEKEQYWVNTSFYNEACNFAIQGDTTRAIESLREALELGFSDPIIWNDPELEALGDLKEFQGLLEQYRSQISPPEEDAGDKPNLEGP